MNTHIFSYKRTIGLSYQIWNTWAQSRTNCCTIYFCAAPWKTPESNLGPLQSGRLTTWPPHQPYQKNATKIFSFQRQQGENISSIFLAGNRRESPKIYTNRNNSIWTLIFGWHEICIGKFINYAVTMVYYNLGSWKGTDLSVSAFFLIFINKTNFTNFRKFYNIFEHSATQRCPEQLLVCLKFNFYWLTTIFYIFWVFSCTYFCAFNDSALWQCSAWFCFALFCEWFEQFSVCLCMIQMHLTVPKCWFELCVHDLNQLDSALSRQQS